MSDLDDAPPVPLRDVRALADLGLDPQAAAPTEDRARRLIAAAVAPSPKRRRFRRLSRRGAGLLGAAALLVGGTAIAATGPWSPQLGGAHRGHPTVATTPVPGDQTAALAVLRRPQTDADRTPRVEALLKLLSKRELGGIRLDSLRLLADRPDGITVLVAVERVGTNDPGYPPQRKHNQLCLFQTATDHARIDGRRVAMTSAGWTCGTVADIAAGRMMSGAQWDGRLGMGGLLPDGVVRVEIPLTGGPTIQAPVVDNTFHVDTAVPVGHYNRNNVRWFDADGRQVHRRWR